MSAKKRRRRGGAMPQQPSRAKTESLPSLPFKLHNAVISGRLAAGICLGAAAMPSVARAATYMVSNFADSGTGSLRQAIISANGVAGADVINFASSLGCGVVHVQGGSMAITDDLTINGPGASSFVLDANHQSNFFSLNGNLNLLNVAISGITMQNGNALVGGAIFAEGSNFSLTDSVVANSNSAGAGGGIAFGANPNAVNPNILIQNCILTGNAALNGQGGGADIPILSKVSIIASTIGNNHSSGGGGGIYWNTGNPNGSLDVQQSLMSGNVSNSWGGGLYVAGGVANVGETTFSGNSAKNNGGGLEVYNVPSFTLGNSTISGNQASGGGGINFGNARGSTMNACTVENNGAVNDGGGVRLYIASNVVLLNTTITGNSGASGGLSLYKSTAALESDTIFANNGNTVGGVFVNDANIAVHNSIIAGNVGDGNGLTDFRATNGNISGTFNLFGDANALSPNDVGNANVLLNSNNILGHAVTMSALGNHGGWTATLLPSVSSPSVGAGDPNVGRDPNVDQRNWPRVAGGRVDLGAVELQDCPCNMQLEGAGCTVAPQSPRFGSSLDPNYCSPPTGGTTTAGLPTGGFATTGGTCGTTGGSSTTGGSTGGKGGGGGSSCAATGAQTNPLAVGGFLAALAGLVLRRRRSSSRC